VLEAWWLEKIERRMFIVHVVPEWIKEKGGDPI